MTEDLQPRLVWSPPHYAYGTERAVRYVSVANDGGVLGYLWVQDEDDAAGFLPREAGGSNAENAGVAWADLLRECKARDLTPSQALAELTDHPGGVRTGRVVPGSEAEVPSLAALEELAAQA